MKPVHQVLQELTGRPALSVTAQRILDHVQAAPRTTSQIAKHLGRHVPGQGARQDVRDTLQLLHRHGLVERQVVPHPRGTYTYTWQATEGP